MSGERVKMQIAAIKEAARQEGFEAGVRPARAEGEQAVTEYRQALWDIYGILGFDTDGDPTPAALVSDLIRLVVDAATEFRAESDTYYDEGRAEGEQAEREPLERIGWMVCNKATHTHTGTVFHTREFADRSLTYYSNEHEVVEVLAALRSVAKEGENGQ